jgi:lipoprotein-releasing system permease protein
MARYQKVVQQRLRNAQELEQERFEQLQQKIQEESQASVDSQADPVASLMAGPGIQIANNAQQISQFDAEKEQRTGIVLGINLGSIRGREPDGTVQDFFFLRPGDDVQVTFPNAGTPPRGIDEQFTIVDFYESKMSIDPNQTQARHQSQ